MKERIAEFIREKAYKPMTLAELGSAMDLSEKQYVQLQKTLEQMEGTGEVVRTRRERYGAPERMNLAVGRLQGHPRGFGFLVPDRSEEGDIFIGRESLNGGWHGDRIVVRLSPPSRAGGRLEGEVIRILQRANPRVVGTFEAARHGGYVMPDDQRLPDDIVVPRGAINGAKSGEKVVVQISRWPDARRGAEGRVVERLGMKGDVGVDILSIIRKCGLPEQFPPRVMKEAERLPEKVTAEAASADGRRDLRDWVIVTIDGEDAKDLDDAVSLKPLGEGRWRLGVHIADVSHYVPEGSAVDREAYARGTSVYLADRVVPMLPPRLSNGICSLNPQEDRLALSCVMDIDSSGQVQQYEVFPSVICTTARMTYTAVNQVLQEQPDAIRQHKSLVPLFQEMKALMEVLRNRRQRRGALDFDLPEAKVTLNELGWPVDIAAVDRGAAEMMIEEFMLVANETVAEHCQLAGVPFMYRIHGEPAADKLAGLKDFLGLFGFNLKLPREGKISPKTLQEITEWSRGRPEENLINSVLLRTMRQAMYNEKNLGHFGLAAEFYCHFTSPIRRYPDLVVHRVLRKVLAKDLTPRQRQKWERWMPEAALHASERERVAMEAERETVDLKKAEYMSDKVGESFRGIISGVSPFGFFVQLPNTVEGLVHVSTLTDDYYHFHEQYYALTGERTRRRFRLGDAVTVRLTGVDVDARQVDFELADSRLPVVKAPAPSRPTRRRAEKKRAQVSGRVKVGGKLRGSTGKKKQAERRPKPQKSKVPQQPAKSGGEANERVDMWGIPVPQGRGNRPGSDSSDSGAGGPFSVSAPQKTSPSSKPRIRRRRPQSRKRRETQPQS